MSIQYYVSRNDFQNRSFCFKINLTVAWCWYVSFRSVPARGHHRQKIREQFRACYSKRRRLKLRAVSKLKLASSYNICYIINTGLTIGPRSSRQRSTIMDKLPEVGEVSPADTDIQLAEGQDVRALLLQQATYLEQEEEEFCARLTEEERKAYDVLCAEADRALRQRPSVYVELAKKLGVTS